MPTTFNWEKKLRLEGTERDLCQVKLKLEIICPGHYQGPRRACANKAGPCVLQTGVLACPPPKARPHMPPPPASCLELAGSPLINYAWTDLTTPSHVCMGKARWSRSNANLNLLLHKRIWQSNVSLCTAASLPPCLFYQSVLSFVEPAISKSEVPCLGLCWRMATFERGS